MHHACCGAGRSLLQVVDIFYLKLFRLITTYTTALLLKESKPYNAIVDKSFKQIINNKYKGVKLICKYFKKCLDKNASYL